MTYSYAGRFAALYDLLYADKPYAAEAAFLDAVMDRVLGPGPKRVLDLACGTGSHALEMTRRGHTVVGLDNSPDMLAEAKRKALAAGLAIEFVLADMADMADMASMPNAGPAFDVVACLFDAIGYVRSNENIRAVLAGVRAALRPGGLFLCEFWHAPAMLRGYEPLRLRRLNLPEADILRLAETSLDIPAQLASVCYTFVELKRDGTWDSFTETQTNRFFQVQEMGAFLHEAGLAALDFFPGFERGVVGPDTWHVLAMAQRPK